MPLEGLAAAEHKAREELERELFKLRDEAGEPSPERQFWRFDDGAPITVICSDLRKSDELVLGPLEIIIASSILNRWKPPFSKLAITNLM